MVELRDFHPKNDPPLVSETQGALLRDLRRRPNSTLERASIFPDKLSDLPIH